MYYIKFKDGTDALSNERSESENVDICMEIENYNPNCYYVLDNGVLYPIQRNKLDAGNDVLDTTNPTIQSVVESAIGMI